jgi:hypothetical protein
MKQKMADEPVEYITFDSILENMLRNGMIATKTITPTEEEAQFDDYESWDDTLYLIANVFKQKHSIYPNIMLASEATYNHIDENVRKNGIKHLEYEGDENPPPEFKGLSSFSTEDFEVNFCLDNDLPENIFHLVYDDDPSFDGEDLDENGQLDHNLMFPGNKRIVYHRYKLAA